MKCNQMRKAKAVNSELFIAREAATITCILAEIRRQTGWETSQWAKRKAAHAPRLEAVGMKEL